MLEKKLPFVLDWIVGRPNVVKIFEKKIIIFCQFWAGFLLL